MITTQNLLNIIEGYTIYTKNTCNMTFTGGVTFLKLKKLLFGAALTFTIVGSSVSGASADPITIDPGPGGGGTSDPPPICTSNGTCIQP